MKNSTDFAHSQPIILLGLGQCFHHTRLCFTEHIKSKATLDIRDWERLQFIKDRESCEHIATVSCRLFFRLSSWPFSFFWTARQQGAFRLCFWPRVVGLATSRALQQQAFPNTRRLKTMSKKVWQLILSKELRYQPMSCI